MLLLIMLKSINLGLTFFLELAMLAAYAYWGFQAGTSTFMKIVLGIGVPPLVAVIWGLFMAPKAARHLQGASYLAVKIVLFGLAIAALFFVGKTSLGIVFAIVFVINTILLNVWK